MIPQGEFVAYGKAVGTSTIVAVAVTNLMMVHPIIPFGMISYSLFDNCIVG